MSNKKPIPDEEDGSFEKKIKNRLFHKQRAAPAKAI